MDPVALILIAVGLAMDAFAVSLCKGMAVKKASLKAMLLAGVWFGGFQALMPVIGYALGSSFHGLVSSFDHWIASALLFLIGANMIREALSDEEEEVDGDMGVGTMALLALATSIDALAVGISMAMEEDGIAIPATVIGIVTMAISMAGIKIGSLFGDRFGRKAEAAGGIVLIAIGLKILLEGLGIIRLRACTSGRSRPRPRRTPSSLRCPCASDTCPGARRSPHRRSASPNRPSASCT